MAKTISADKVCVLLERNLRACAPVRTVPNPSGRGYYGKPPFHSPYPGNLRQNGIRIETRTGAHAVVAVGGVQAAYAMFTDPSTFGTGSKRTPRTDGWVTDAVDRTVNQILAAYGGTKK